MHAVRSGHLTTASPASYLVSTPASSSSFIWRSSRSTVSSPEFSDSKDEEDMDIDQDENSPRSDSFLQLSSSLFSNHGTQSMFSLSELSISEQKTPAASYKKAGLSKRAHSFPATSVNLAKDSVWPVTSESADSEQCRLSKAKRASTPDAKKAEQLSLVPWKEVNGGTLKSVSLSQGEHTSLFSAKSFLFSASLLLVAVAVFLTCIQQPAATQCVNHIDVESLHHELRHRVHGQHIAVNVVVRSLREFISTSDRRLLVLSFHGWTGIGKNFMSSIVAQHLPPTNVHKLIIPLHFARGTDSDGLLLSEWIVSNTTCGLHLFIVDEIDKADSSVVQSLRETLSQLSLQSDTRAIFLLLTNDGATEINTAVTEVLLNGGTREDLGYVDLVPRLSSEWYTELVSSDLIDKSVPFLPLERSHVALCAETELKRRRVPITRQLVYNIVNSLSYFPTDVSLFSSSGCRRVTHLVDIFL